MDAIARTLTFSLNASGFGDYYQRFDFFRFWGSVQIRGGSL